MDDARSSSEVLTWFITLVIVCTCLITQASAKSIFISNNAMTEKGESVQITCQLDLTLPWTSNVYIYRTETSSISSVNDFAVCHEYRCLPTSLNRFEILSDGYNIYINITSLDRKDDEKYWTCINTDTSVTLFLTVYTSPTAALVNSSSSHSHSLSDGPVSLTCRTDICTYKDPIFEWHIMLGNGSQQIFKHGQRVLSSSSSSCNDSEKIYYSSLNLRKNMTLPGNVDMRVQFVCGISFPTFLDELISLPTGNVSFAVQITSVQLYDGNLEPMDETIITVTENVNHSITCKSGPSRPPPTYTFYIGINKMSESKNNTLTFMPNRNQHDMIIYCKAYNLQEPDNAVVSSKPRLFVNVPVNSVILKDGDFELDSCSVINATEGSPKTLTCFAGVNRPSPIFVWYIESEVRQNHTSSTFTFMPQMNDHDRTVYCIAFNLQGFQTVTSFKPRLYIVGRPVQPRTFFLTGSYGSNVTFYWIAGFNGGFNQWFILQYRKVGSNDWLNHTQIEEITATNEVKTSLDQYRTKINNLAPGEYQARLIAGNIKGEAAPVNMMDSTFSVESNGHCEMSSLQTSTSSSPSTTPIIGAALGSLIAILLGIIIFLCVWLRRKQMKDIPPATVKLEQIPVSQVQPGHTYEDIGTSAEPSISTYDTLDSTNITLPRQTPSSLDYENTAV